MTFPQIDPPDIQTIIESKTRMERVEDIFDVRASLKILGPFSIRVGYTDNSAEITVANDPSEVVIPGGQGGSFDRKIQTVDAGLLFKLSGVTLGVDYVTAVGGQRRRQDRLPRPRPAAPARRVGAGEVVPHRSHGRDGRHVQRRLRATPTTAPGTPMPATSSWPPGSGSASGSARGASTETPPSRTASRRPGRPRRRCTPRAATLLEGGLTFNLKPFTVEALLRHFENEGSFPYELDKARVRADLEFSKLIGIAAEWDLDDYTELNRSYGSGADYKANRYGLYLRIHP